MGFVQKRNSECLSRRYRAEATKSRQAEESRLWGTKRQSGTTVRHKHGEFDCACSRSRPRKKREREKNTRVGVSRQRQCASVGQALGRGSKLSAATKKTSPLDPPLSRSGQGQGSRRADTRLKDAELPTTHRDDCAESSVQCFTTTAAPPFCMEKSCPLSTLTFMA